MAKSEQETAAGAELMALLDQAIERAQALAKAAKHRAAARLVVKLKLARQYAAQLTK